MHKNSLVNLCLHFQDFDHSPLRRLFEEERATRTSLACGVISGTDEDVIHLAILLKLDEDIKDEYQLDLDWIYTFVGRSLTRVVSTNERKLLLCQAILLQQTGRVCILFRIKLDVILEYCLLCVLFVFDL